MKHKILVYHDLSLMLNGKHKTLVMLPIAVPCKIVYCKLQALIQARRYSGCRTTILSN